MSSPPDDPPAPEGPTALTMTPITTKQQQQQQQQPLNITHADYDWMGVLDTLDAEGFDPGGAAHHQSPPPKYDAYRHQQQYVPVENPLTTAAVGSGGVRGCTVDAATVAAAAVAAAAATATHASPVEHQPDRGAATAAVAALSIPPLPSGNYTETEHPISDLGDNKREEEDDGKASSLRLKHITRIERKRNREKQRRLDTNSQFNALAEIVREIEVSDLAEEAARGGDYLMRGEADGNSMSGGSMGTHVAAGNNNDRGGTGAGEDDDGGNGIATGTDNAMEAPPNSTTASDSNNDNDPSKRLKSENSNPMPPPPLPASYNASNRVDLIAHTISQLRRFRSIRRRQNNELRDLNRENCEARKECEGLRRAVAHYKAMELDSAQQMKPKEKVMMMVPMMVPQDAVNQISQGYPAAHQYGTTAAANPHPWMAKTVSAFMAYPDQPAVATMQDASVMTHPSNPSMHYCHPSAPHVLAPAPTGWPTTNIPPPELASDPQPTGTPNFSDVALHEMPQQAIAVAMPPAMAMYPQVTDGIPSVAYGLHPHAHHGASAPPYHYAQQNAAPGLQHPHQAAPMTSTATDPASAAATASLMAAHAAATQQQQQYPHGQAPPLAPQDTSQHPQMGMAQPPPDRQPSTEKLTATAHQGNSGGNLAHCA